VEDIEVSVLNSSLVKIGRGEGLSMKGGGVFPIALVMNTDKMSIFIDTPVTNISGGFRLSFLVKEDNGIEVRLSTVIPYLSRTESATSCIQRIPNPSSPKAAPKLKYSHVVESTLRPHDPGKLSPDLSRV